jgi:hypothetical protein
VGSYFNRSTNKSNPGYQIDLLFDRDDKVITICEIKYTQDKISSSVISDVERKIELFSNPKNKTIQRILISVHGADDSVIRRHYFDRVISLTDWFEPIYWQ